MIRVGTAGWAVPKAVSEHFAGEGTALHRYACVFNCAEINSTFYRSHRISTYERWAQSVPNEFRFSVKVPKEITHVRSFVDCGALLAAFLEETAALGEKRGVLLVQLPPKLAYDQAIAEPFFTTLRSLYGGDVALEPRHPSWFDDDVDSWLQTIGVARVATDPARLPQAAQPGGSTSLTYVRLHGSPRMYYSAYDDGALAPVAQTLLGARDRAWCIFDNTASGAAAGDALRLLEALRGQTPQHAS